VRSLVERRKVMVAWYTAVTINTVASYQVFLASYRDSDFALTADRLLARASTRSITDAGAAFAATGPTCPCSQPATPILRQKRTDTTPTQNTKTPGTGVAVVDPTPAVTVNPVPPVVATPPVIVVPPRISVFPKPPRDKHKPPRGDDHPKSTGDGKGGKPSGTYGSTNNPQVLRGKVNTNTRHVNTNAATTTATKPPAPSPFSIGIGFGIGLGGRSAAPHQSGGSRNMGHVGSR
jgi:hypothetical protein